MRRGQWECTGAGRKDGSVEQGAVYVKVWRAGRLASLRQFSHLVR